MQTVSALFRDRAHATGALDEIARLGLGRVRMAPARELRGLSPRVRTIAPEGGLLGGVVGALFGSLVAASTYFVPTLPLAAEEIANVVRSGMLAGAVVGFQ